MPNTNDLLKQHLIQSMEEIQAFYKTRFHYPSYDDPNTSHALNIDSPYFEKKGNGDGFIIKEGISASNAIKSLFSDGEHTLDCASTTLLAQYEAIRRTLTAKMGEEEGNKSFDLLFGSDADKTPDKRRLFISKHLAQGAHPDFRKNIQSTDHVNPLLAFIDYTEMAKVTGLDNNAVEVLMKPGEQLYITGHPNYPQKHPFGSSPGWNVIKVDNNQYIGFGLSNKPISKDEVKQLLLENYNKPQNASTLQSSSYNPSLKDDQGTIDDIVGLQSTSAIQFEPEKLDSYIQNPMQFIDDLDQFIDATQEKLMSDILQSVRSSAGVFSRESLSTRESLPKTQDSEVLQKISTFDTSVETKQALESFVKRGIIHRSHILYNDNIGDLEELVSNLQDPVIQELNSNGETLIESRDIYKKPQAFEKIRSRASIPDVIDLVKQGKLHISSLKYKTDKDFSEKLKELGHKRRKISPPRIHGSKVTSPPFSKPNPWT